MTEIREAPRELLALAVAVRPDWDPDDTWNALLAARAAGWDFPGTLRETIRLLLQDDSEPHDLRYAAKAPAVREPPGSLPAALRAQVLDRCGQVTEALRQHERRDEPGTGSAA